jgi:hypothetical protein
VVALVGELEQREDFLGVAAIQVAGWLIGEDQSGVIDQRPADGDALLLPAGELVGTVRDPVPSPSVRRSPSGASVQAALIQEQRGWSFSRR